MTTVDSNWVTYAIRLGIVALLTYILGVRIIWMQRKLPGWRTAFFLLTASTLWVISSIGEFASSSFEIQVWWVRLEWLCLAIIPTVWFFYGLLYNNWVKKMDWRHFLIISIVPIIVYTLFLTNDSHGLLFDTHWVEIDNSIPLFKKSLGPVSWVYIFYAYFLLAFGFVMIIYNLIISKRITIWQVIISTIIILVPWIFVMVNLIFDIKNFPDIDLTSLALVITNPVLIWSASRRQLRSLSLYSIDTVFESLNTAIFLIGANDSVLDLNRAGEQLVKNSVIQPHEKYLSEIVEIYSGELDLSSDAEDCAQIISFLSNGEVRTFQANLSQNRNWLGKVTSKVLVLSDITEHVRLYEQAQAEIGERMKAEQIIKESLQEKEILLKEIHHRVKNNLQIISSLLNLQSDQTSNQVVSAFVTTSQNRIHSMALIHEMLYQSGNMAQVRFDDYVRNLVSHFKETAYPPNIMINFEIEIDEILLDIDTAIQCGLILNELVSNSLEHAFPQVEQGLIHIKFSKAQHGYLLCVQDDGIGLAEEINVTKTDTLGLKLVSALVQQLGGEVELDRSGGTRFSIIFIDAV